MRCIVYIAIVLLAYSACSLEQEKNAMPNVVLILTDDQGWGDVGFNGNKIINTPTLDSLAAKSVVFDRFYVSPVCAPTRASLLTGKDHLATGASWVTHRKEVMRESEITIAEILKAKGYKTGCFGKWHNGAQYPHNPNGQGFDTFFGFSAGHWNNYFNTTLEFNGRRVQTKGYITDVITDSVTSFIKNTKEPFFAYVAYNTPHTPYQVDDKYFDKYNALNLDVKTAAIYGMCENIDDNIRRIDAALRETGKNEETIFIFLSDNGPNYVRYNGGFKGRKAQVHEGGVRVPFFIKYPEGNLQIRRVENNYGAHVDLLPTILDLCNISNMNLAFDGISLLPVLKSTDYKLADRSFYSHHILSGDAFCGAIRNNEYLLTCYPNDTSLYDLLDDPYQMKEISESNLELVDSLSKQYAMWLQNATIKGLDPESIHIGDNQITTIEFPAHEANLYGDVKFAGGAGWANDWVTNFSDNRDLVSWNINVVQSGTYKAQVKFACSKKDLGTELRLSTGHNSVLKEIRNVELGGIIQNSDRVKRAEVDERQWGILDFGVIKINEFDNILLLNYMGSIQSDLQIKELVLNRIQ